MKSLKLSFDFSDMPKLVELLRLEAVTSKKSQKNILVEALNAYFAAKTDIASLYKLGEKTFAEWDNPEDAVYDDL